MLCRIARGPALRAADGCEIKMAMFLKPPLDSVREIKSKERSHLDSSPFNDFSVIVDIGKHMEEESFRFLSN